MVKQTVKSKVAAKSVSISLPEPYLSYVEKAKTVKGWSTSELIRRALDMFMPNNPVGDATDSRSGKG